MEIIDLELCESLVIVVLLTSHFREKETCSTCIPPRIMVLIQSELLLLTYIKILYMLI